MCSSWTPENEYWENDKNKVGKTFTLCSDGWWLCIGYDKLHKKTHFKLCHLNLKGFYLFLLIVILLWTPILKQYKTKYRNMSAIKDIVRHYSVYVSNVSVFWPLMPYFV